MGEITKHYLISGRVQGVGYRAFTQRSARELGLRGWVRNLTDGRVEAMVCGSVEAMQRLEVRLKSGPSHGHVETLLVKECAPVEIGAEFTVRKDGSEPCSGI